MIELATEKQATSINLEGLQQGVYLLQIQTENEIFIQKFIKN
ncbi:MAG: T9SS type A sorting domain-containing protein [Bacteroidetes bacterium]|nr:T9SS type A sorting domain-containing protein [Bacteroidota bacterium]